MTTGNDKKDQSSADFSERAPNREQPSAGFKRCYLLEALIDASRSD